MTSIADRSAILAGTLGMTRRKMGLRSPRSFAHTYLPHHFRTFPSRMHNEVFAKLLIAEDKRGSRIAIAAPRGHAKSTVVSLAHVLWSALYAKERFILIVSATREQAVQLLKIVKDEIQGNERLLSDFPELCARPGSVSAPRPWRSNSIALSNGVMIRALGAGQALRGMRHGPHRPTLIIVDDLEDQEQVQSSEQRAKLRDWFEKTLLKAGDDRTNIVMVGTILHYDSLLANLTSSKRVGVGGGRSAGAGWDSAIYRAVENFSSRGDLWDMWESIRCSEVEFEGRTGPEASAAFCARNETAMLEGTKVLWPERESYVQLMAMRVDEGRQSFQSEKQNEPLDPDTCIFRDEKFKFWDTECPDVPALLARLGNRVRYYGACDPSLGKRGGDFTAIITLAEDAENKVIYVIEADLARRTPDETITRIAQLARVTDYRAFCFEANQFQQVMADQLKHRLAQERARLKFIPVIHRKNKQERIESLEPLIATGQLRFHHRHQQLLEQLRQFPMGAHDDGPDALEMAVSETIRHRGAAVSRRWK